MTNQDIKKAIRREIKQIEFEYDPAEWDYKEVDRMDAAEAYNRGYHRALKSCLSMLEDDYE